MTLFEIEYAIDEQAKEASLQKTGERFNLLSR